MPAGKALSPTDIVSKTSSSMAWTMACWAAGHLFEVLMLALACSTISIAAGACCAWAENVVHAPSPSGTSASPSSPPPVPVSVAPPIPVMFPAPVPPAPLPPTPSDEALLPVAEHPPPSRAPGRASA